MKKFFFVLVFSSLLFSLNEVRAYTSSDASNATFLAEQGIIMSQSSTKWYRLDDTITRAEAIGIALKIKWITLPNNYTCKNYFIDAPYNPSNNWICRAVELAKDNGIVSWENIKARPADPITRSEVLAMIMHAALNNSLSIVPKWYKFSTDTVEWQQNIFYAAEDMITVTGTNYDYTTRPISVNYFPNRNATRAEVFSFAEGILNNTNSDSLDQFWLWLADNIFFELDSTDASYWIYKLRFWTKREVCNNGCRAVYPTISIQTRKMSVTDELIEVWYGEFQGVKIVKGVMYLHYKTHDMCEGNNYITFNDRFSFRFAYICQADTFLEDSTILNFTNDMYEFNSIDVLRTYYELLNNAEEWTTYLRNQAYFAYQMRAPSWASEETFHSWYKNVTSVIFRENTLKDLWDNTYEFLVDMTESGVKTTYKVKSKVDLANFKINNISSVKQ